MIDTHKKKKYYPVTPLSCPRPAVAPSRLLLRGFGRAEREGFTAGAFAGAVGRAEVRRYLNLGTGRKGSGKASEVAFV